MAKGMSFKVLMQLQTKEFRNGIKAIERQLNGFKNFMKSAFALGSITMFGRQMVEVGKDFENAMARVQAVSNATTDEFKAMQAEAQKLGKTTRYTATEAANALENLTRNGMSASQATKALSGVLQLAQANSIELASAADIVTNTLNMFGLSIENTARVNDVLSSTASHAATDITGLYEAMVNAAPAANVLGFSIEEVSAAIGALAQKGVKGSEAGTKMRIALQKMADPKVIGKMKEYGIDVDEATMKSEGLRKTLEKIAKANLSLGELGKIFDAKSAMAIQLMTASLSELDYMLDVTMNSAGETERMFKQGVGSVQKELDTLKSSYEGLLISISQKTSGVVNSSVKLLQNLIGNFETIGGTIANLASVVVPLLIGKIMVLGRTATTVLGQMAAGVTALKTAMGGWVTIVATLVTWIGTALVGAWNKAHREMREANKKMTEATAKINDMQRSVQKLKEKIGDGSDSASLTAALKEATRLFPEFADAINDARRIAAQTGEWENLKGLLQDIADLQSLVITREAKQALANAKARKIGNQMYDEGAPLNRNTEVLAAQDIRKAFKDAGFTNDEIRDRFTEIARIIGESKSGMDAVREVEKYLDDYEIKINDGLLMTWLERHVKTGLLPDDYIKSGDKQREEMSGLQQTNRDIHTTDSTYAVQNYKTWKKHFDQQEKELRDRLGNISQHQKEFNDEMAKYVKELADKTIEGLPQESDEYKELATLLKAYPMPKKTGSSGGGGGVSSGKSPKEPVSEALKNYDEKVTELNNRLNAGTISAEDYASEMKNLVDKTWEAITAVSGFERVLESLGKGELGAQLAGKYAQNRSDEKNLERNKKIDEQYKELAKYFIPEKGKRDTSRDYKKTETEKKEEQLKIDIDYKESIDNLIDDLQEAINNGEFDLVKGDAINLLKQLRIEALAAAASVDDLQTKLDMSEVVAKLDEQIKALEADVMNTFEGFSSAMDRITSGLWAIAQIFDEDLKDSPYFQAFEAFNSVLNSSIQIMQGVMSAIELVKQIQSKAAKEKLKDALISAGADKIAAKAALEKATAEGTDAAASGAKSVANIPYVGPVLAVAAIASIVTALLAAGSKLKGFAKGGIVGGSSYAGDNNVIRANSSEMVLTRGQQASLWRAIQSGDIGSGGKVDFVIRGDQLVGTLQNYNRLRK